MATLITIRTDRGDFATSTKEDMPLDYDMLDAGKEFRYSVGTTDTDYAESKIKIANTIRQLLTALGRERSVSSVHLSNATEFVTFTNARIKVLEFAGEYYLEVMSKQITTGYNNSPSKKRTYEK